MRPPTILILGFAGLILAGTLLLWLPLSARDGQTDLLAALFTATSAVCVTGLAVVDTSSHWSPFGQLVITALMELGGLGFMIGATLMVLALGRRTGLQHRLLLHESGSTTRLGGQSNLIVRTVLFTLACEAAGSLILALRFVPLYGFGRGLWLAAFHAISAFTNGSFDLFHGRGLADFRGDLVVILPLAALIVVGGLGFVVVDDVYRERRWHRFTLDTKVVLAATSALLVAGTLVIFLIERGNAASLGPLPFGAQVLGAFFTSVGARTCGFNTWDLAQSDPRSLFFLMGLMFVGGASGSTAGGIKIGTLATIAAAVWASVRGHPDAMLFKRRLQPRQVGQAYAVAVLAIWLIATVTLGISFLEGARLRPPLLDLLFEVTSAFGTVGYGVGVTTQLSPASKLLLVATMFIGRLGPVTVASALTAQPRTGTYRRPSETLRIG